VYYEKRKGYAWGAQRFRDEGVSSRDTNPLLKSSARRNSWREAPKIYDGGKKREGKRGCKG